MDDFEGIDISVVIPVYKGRETLPSVVQELAHLTRDQISPGGIRYRVKEALLVWDRGPDASDEILRALERNHAFVRVIWLSRNFGQHAATLAGMTSSVGTWIVTMDEDGQHDPLAIGDMLDTAYGDKAELVYAAPSNTPPHSLMRNFASRVTKLLFVRVLSTSDFQQFNSFRLILGEVGRSSAAYTGSGVYLDVALSWVVSRVTTCPVSMRSEGRPAGSYTPGKLLAHFGRLLVSSGSRPLAVVSVVGLIVFLFGLAWSVWIIWEAISGVATPQGWTSVFVGLLLIGGLNLFFLGIVAQYVRVTSDSALGRPLYVVVTDPRRVFG